MEAFPTRILDTAVDQIEEALEDLGSGYTRGQLQAAFYSIYRTAAAAGAKAAREEEARQAARSAERDSLGECRIGDYVVLSAAPELAGQLQDRPVKFRPAHLALPHLRGESGDAQESAAPPWLFRRTDRVDAEGNLRACWTRLA